MEKDKFLLKLADNMRPLISLAVAVFLCVLMADAALDISNLQKSIDSYNSNINKAPPMLRMLLGDEKINVAILMNNGSTVAWGFETKNAEIVRSVKGGIENPSIDAYATMDAVRRVINAADPIAAYRDAEKTGEISIKCNTWSAQMKLAAALSSSEAVKFFFQIIR